MRVLNVYQASLIVSESNYTMRQTRSPLLPIRTLVFCLLALLWSAHFVEAQTTRKVLFLGNSYTGYNNMPQLVKDMATSVGDNLIVDQHHPGGYTLEGHFYNATSLAKIAANNWDYVALQGQSRESITQPNLFRDGAWLLRDHIKSTHPCATPLFYMTWGRKNGDATLWPDFPITCTYEGMDSTIRHNYINLASTMHAEVAPVSAVWNYLRQNNPNIELYASDGSHPSVAGSYAVACCFYTAIFRKDPSLITFDHTLSATTATAIRNATKNVVFDQLGVWDYKEPALAQFRYQVINANNGVQFINTSQFETLQWDFGDGSTSTDVGPTHTYINNGAYTATLTVNTCDVDGAHTSVADTVIEFCNHTPTIFTNKTRVCEVDTLQTEPADSYQWFLGPSPIPETGASITDFVRYGSSNFMVKATVAGCTELSQLYSFWPDWSGYYSDLGWSTGDPCEGDTLTIALLNAITGMNGQEIIRWYHNGQLLPQANDRDTLLITDGGTYQFKVVDPTSECPTDTTTETITFDTCEVVGIHPQPNQDLTWSVFPNPASQTISLDFPEGQYPETIQVFTATGKLFLEIPSSSHPSLSVADWPAGLYLIRPKDTTYPPLQLVKH